MARTLRRSTARASEAPAQTDDYTEEKETPRRGGRRSRSADREPEEDEAPRRGRRSGRSSRDEDSVPTAEVASGWDGYEAERQEYEERVPDFGKTLKEAQDDDRDVLIKFVDEAPVAVYKQHWIDERKGKKSFTCIGKGCPICAAGDRPATKTAFNVISLDDPDEPRVEVWTVGQKIADLIKKMSVDKKTSPLNREDLYFAVSRSGKKGGNVQTNISSVKERDLKEDWDTDPLTDDELDEFDEKAFDKSEAVEYSKMSTLEDVADFISR